MTNPIIDGLMAHCSIRQLRPDPIDEATLALVLQADVCPES